MNIFRRLRWQLTWSYTLVTVSAFLVVLLIATGGIALPRLFLPKNYLNPPDLVEILRENTTPLWSEVLSQSPVDTTLIRMLLKGSDATITNSDFLRIGSMQFSVRTLTTLDALVIGADGTLLGKTELFLPAAPIGQPFDTRQIQGLEDPLNAALAGETDADRLYSIFEPSDQLLLAIPIIHTSEEAPNQIVGTIVVILGPLPTQAAIPAHILEIAGRSLLIFLLGVGSMGAIFGAYFAHGLSERFTQISATIDLWSAGDFSRVIDDTTGDEVSQFAGRLNAMAKQLQSLLHRRQEMAVSEERNRLARDLHDSAKQQALAASLELSTALTLYERDPGGAKTHLVEAEALVDEVRKELTNLVDELRPQPMDGQDISENLKEYVMEWSKRSGIDLNIHIEENDLLSSETSEALFRIAQEALANIARHSSASSAEISLNYETNSVTMVIKDDGCGFDANNSHSGMGLSSMQERAEALGGRLAVGSAPGQGTQVTVSLPIAK